MSEPPGPSPPFLCFSQVKLISTIPGPHFQTPMHVENTLPFQSHSWGLPPDDWLALLPASLHVSCSGTAFFFRIILSSPQFPESGNSLLLSAVHLLNTSLCICLVSDCPSGCLWVFVIMKSSAVHIRGPTSYTYARFLLNMLGRRINESRTQRC